MPKIKKTNRQLTSKKKATVFSLNNNNLQKKNPKIVAKQRLPKKILFAKHELRQYF